MFMDSFPGLFLSRVCFSIIIFFTFCNKSTVGEKSVHDQVTPSGCQTTTPKRNENYAHGTKNNYEWIDDIENYDENEYLHNPFKMDPVLVERIVEFPNFPIFAPTSEAIKNKICREDAQSFLEELKKFKMWALMMYDASAKLPSGVLEGNGFQLGHFDECLRIKAYLREKSKEKIIKVIRGKYCLASFDISTNVKTGAIPQAVNLAEAKAALRSTVNDASHGFPRGTTLNWGLCVPSSCSPDDIQIALENGWTHYSNTTGVEVKFKVENNACVDREDMGIKMSFLSYFTGFILLFACILAIYATVMENVMFNRNVTENNNEETGKLRKIIFAFSLNRSIRELTKPAEGKDEVSCIHGIKAIFGLLLYIGHKCVIIVTPPYDNKNDVIQISNEPFSAILRASIIYADGFLFLSGFLMSCSLTREIITEGKISWARRIWMRFVRFTPPMLVLVMIYGYLSEHLGSGPMWGQVVGRNAELCRMNGWKNIFHIQNYGEYDEMCAPQTHQVAIDTQLSIAAPILVYLLHRYKIGGFVTVTSLCLFSCALRYYITYANSLSILFFHKQSVQKIYEMGNLIHGKPLQRATPYIFGIINGYYIKKYDRDLRGKITPSLVTAGFIASGVILIALFGIAIHTASPYYVYDKHFAAFYSSIVPLITSFVLAWLVSANYLGYGGKINDFFSSKPLVIFSRITYSLYLVQFLVFFHSIGELRAPLHFSWFSTIGSLDFVSLLLATALTLIFDYPFKEVQSILSAEKKTHKINSHREDQKIE